MNTNHRTVFLLLFFSLFSTWVYPQGVAFKEISDDIQLDSMFNLALKNTKPLCFYIYSPSCPGCAEMNQRVFSDTKLATTFNLTFLNLKVNFESDFGHSFIEKYNIQNLPSVIFTDPAGHNLGKIYDASVSTEGLRQIAISTASMFYDMLSLRDTFYTQKNKQAETAREVAFLLTRLNYFDEGKTVADVYFRNINSFNYDQYEWFLMQTYLKNPAHPLFVKFLQEKSRFEEIYGKDPVENYLNYVFESSFINAINQRDTSLLRYTLNILDYVDYREMSKKGISHESAKLFFRTEYFRSLQDWNNFALTVEKFMTTSFVPDELATDYILDICRFLQSDEWINKADGWASAYYKKNKSFGNTLAYAFTRYKKNDLKKSEKLMKKAEKLMSGDEDKALFENVKSTLRF